MSVKELGRDEVVKSKWKRRGREAGWDTNDLKNDSEKGRQKGLTIVLHSGVLSLGSISR